MCAGDPEDKPSESAPDVHGSHQRDPNRAHGGEGVSAAVEIGGPKGLEPTRYGDWERNGRCSDF